MLIYVITPSLNQCPWLTRCIHSVADQAGAGLCVHHHVQDGGSTDGTVAWLTDYAARVEAAACPGYRFSFESASDDGMYAAINRGWDQAPPAAEVLAHLNCDEQYLPGALEGVAAYFQRNEAIEVALAGMIVVDEAGSYLCHRRPLPPRRPLTAVRTPGFTCATFIRRSVFFDRGVRYDPSWRVIGDKVWFRALHESGGRFGILNIYSSVFAQTGANLAFTPERVAERRRYDALLPHWLQLLGPFLFQVTRIWLGLRMVGSRPPLSYALYLQPTDATRTVMPIARPTCIWPAAHLPVSKRYAVGEQTSVNSDR